VQHFMRGHRAAYDAVQRAIDILVALVGLVLLLPVLAAAAVAVAIDSPGSPLYFQERVGRYGLPFRIVKLRTMVANAEDRRAEIEHLNEAQPPLFKVRKDPRITHIGRFLRATSLDELPQLLNVIVGQMSLVGPRPPLPHEVATYTATQARRLTVIPGLTGLWQVSGRSECTFDELIALDLHYIDHWTFWLDLVLIARTFLVVITGRGAY